MLALTSSTPAQESAQHLGNHHTHATEGRRRLSPIGYEPVASSELTQASRLPHWQPVMSDSPSGLIHDHRKRIARRATSYGWAPISARAHQSPSHSSLARERWNYASE